jgi:hypothetical protein
MSCAISDFRRALTTRPHSQADCQRLTLSAGGKKFTTAHECPLYIATKGSLPRFIGLHGKKEGSILSEHTSYKSGMLPPDQLVWWKKQCVQRHTVSAGWHHVPHCKKYTAVSVPTVWRQTHLSVWSHSLATSLSRSLPDRLLTVGIYKICSGCVDELKVNTTEAINANNQDPLLAEIDTGFMSHWECMNSYSTLLQDVIFKKYIFSGSWDSVVGIVTVYRLDDQGVGVQVPEESSVFSSPRHPDWLWDPPSLLFNGYQVFFSPGVKRPGREADHSPPTSAEVKKTWLHRSTPPYAFMV